VPEIDNKTSWSYLSVIFLMIGATLWIWRRIYWWPTNAQSTYRIRLCSAREYIR